MVAVVVVVVDEGGDGGFEFPFEEVVFQQDPVLQGLMPPLDFALRLWMHRRAANVFHALALVRRRMIWNIRGDFGAEVIGSSGLGYAALR